MQRHPDLTTILPPGAGTIELAVAWQAQAPPIPPHAAAYIEERWAHYLAQAHAGGRTLFDGPITQVLAVNCEPQGGVTRVMLQLAPSTYKDFLVTCLRDRLWFQTHAPDCRIEALGNSALVTRGDQALLGRRSPQVSCYAGRLHMIGGVLEALNTPAFPATPAGIQAHLWLELHEEIGLRDGEARRDGWPRVLGLARDQFLGQPELFWQWEMETDLEKLRNRMAPAEHSEAVILERGGMTDALWQELTPVARLAWELWAGGAG